MRIKLFFIIIASLFSTQLWAQVTMLSSNPMKKKQFMAFTSFQAYEGYNKYDWNNSNWNTIPETDRTTTFSMLSMVGYGVTDKLSMYIQYPIYEQLKNRNFTFSQGEITVMSRYAIIPSTAQKSGLTLIGALRFPTAPVKDNSFADGSVDFIFGEIFSTKWYSNWRTHIKSAYIINTKNSVDENPGDEFQIYLKQDYKWGKVKIYMNNSFTYQSKKINAASELVNNSQNFRFCHQLGIEYAVKNKFFIKPKFQIPSYAKGGILFKEKYVLDLIYYI